jgi:hypothetical protein
MRSLARSATSYVTDQPQKRHDGWQLLPSSHQRHHRRQGRATASSRSRVDPLQQVHTAVLEGNVGSGDQVPHGPGPLRGQSRVFASIIRTSLAPSVTACALGPAILADPSALRDRDEFPARWIDRRCFKAGFTDARLGRHRAPGYRDRASHQRGDHGRHDDDAPPDLPGEACGRRLPLHVGPPSSLRMIGPDVRQQARPYGAVRNRGKPFAVKRPAAGRGWRRSGG